MVVYFILIVKTFTLTSGRPIRSSVIPYSTITTTKGVKMIRKHHHNRNMTEGPIFGKLFIFAIPILFTGVLQLLFNAADMAVVGRYAPDGELAVGAVGACTALINLIVNTAMGMSIGVGVSVAHDIGSGDHARLKKVVHTAVSFSALLGVGVALIGFTFAEPLLRLMGTPESILPMSVPYMKAYFIGVPACMVYNYSAAAIRSSGDTTSPLIFLATSGVVNVLLNLVMVLGFGMGAVGVGIATAASQYVAMTLALIYMIRTDRLCKIDLKEIKPDSPSVKRILRLGAPSGLSSMLFALSNVLIQSTVNSYGDIVISGHATAANIDGIVYICMYSISQAIIVFAGQNMGAAKFKRLDRVLVCGMSLATLVGVCASSIALLLSKPLLNFFTPGETAVIEAGMRRLIGICAPYFLCGLMDVTSHFNKGIGKQIVPTLIALIGNCLMRVIWIFTICRIFPGSPDMPNNIYYLYLSYPVTWTIAFVANVIYYLFLRKKLISGRLNIHI